MRQKRGQFALEFIMTYGWAFLVVLIVVSTLAYMGVFNPSQVASSRCFSKTGIACIGMPLIEKDKVAFTLKNGLGMSILIDTSPGKIDMPAACNAVYLCNQGDLTCTNTSRAISEDDVFTVVSYCNLSTVNDIHEDYTLKYTKPQGAFDYPMLVTISGRVS